MSSARKLHVFGRPEVTRILRDAGSDTAQKNKHGLTPLACALGGVEGQWQRFSNATLEDWRRCVELLQGRRDHSSSLNR